MHTGRRFSIFRTLLIAQTLLISLVLLGSMFFSQRYYEQSTIEQSLTESRELINMIGLNFSNYFAEARNAAHRIAVNGNTKILCRSYGDMPWNQRLPRVRELESLLAYTGMLKNYVYSIAVVGQQGFRCVDSGAPSYSYDTIAALPYVQPYLLGQDASTRYLSLHSYDYLPEMQAPYVARKRIVSVIAPVVVESRVIGCVIIDLDYGRMRDIFALLNKDQGRMAYMIDDQGQYLFHRDPDMDGKTADMAFIGQLSGQTGGFMSNSADRIHTLYYRDETTGWYEVVETDYDHLMRYAGRAQRNSWLLLGFGLLTGVVVSYLIARAIRRPLARLTQRMDIIEQSGFQSAPANDFLFRELNQIDSHFEHMVQRVNQLIENEYIANVRQKDAAFKALQAQVTPHFMQNTLQMIKAEVVLGHNQEAGRVITMLGRLLNYSMHNTQDLSPIRMELDYIVNYLEIFKKRHDGRIDYSIRIDDSISGLEIPRMSLQPLIENSIKYGGDGASQDAPLFIRVYGRQQDGEILLSIYDNGPGLPPDKLAQIQAMLAGADSAATDHNIGLINTHLRIRHYCGPQYGLTIKSEERVYTQITLHFPPANADQRQVRDE